MTNWLQRALSPDWCIDGLKSRRWILQWPGLFLLLLFTLLGGSFLLFGPGALTYIPVCFTILLSVAGIDLLKAVAEPPCNFLDEMSHVVPDGLTDVSDH